MRSCWNVGVASAEHEAPSVRLNLTGVTSVAGAGGGDAFDGEDFPLKPKGMHWKTYQRLEERYDELKSAWTVGMLGLFGFGR